MLSFVCMYVCVCGRGGGAGVGGEGGVGVGGVQVGGWVGVPE